MTLYDGGEKVDPRLIVHHNGIPILVLDKDTMDKFNAWHNLEKIKAMHVTRLDIEEAISDETDETVLRELVLDWELCQFELQKLWGFKEDHTQHKFWELPKCICPVHDNRERLGTPYKVIRLKCPLHGSH